MTEHANDQPALFDVIIPTARFGPRTDGLLQDLTQELTAHATSVGRLVVVDDEAVTDVRDRLLSGGRDTRVDRPSATNGPAVNRNRGARDSHATWLIFLDDDVRLPEGWGTRLVELLSANPPIDLIGGCIGSQRPRNWFSQAAEDFVVRHRRYPEGWYLAAAHLFVRRDAYEKLGGFSESFAYGGEDWDISQRAHSLGLRVGVEPGITVRHANPTTWSQLALKARQYGTANGDLDTLAAEVSGYTPEAAGGRLPSPTRALKWLASEYRILRDDGRGRFRATHTLALYMPWMVVYLRAQKASS